MIIYLITNRVNGKQYVGQTIKSLERRWQGHQEKGNVLHKAIKRYGAEAFDILLLQTCLSKEEMDISEVFYIQLLSTKVPKGYNITDGGGGPIGHKHSAATRAKISQALRDRVRRPESYKKASLALTGRKFTPERIAQMSRISRGNTNLKGFKFSSESRAKMSASHVGLPWSEKRRAAQELRKELRACQIQEF